jgi:hypothetical protein
LPHVRYQGKGMTLDQRLQAVRTFQQNDKAMILLMSLKAGGVGLNLTRGNRKHSLPLNLPYETAYAFTGVINMGKIDWHVAPKRGTC